MRLVIEQEKPEMGRRAAAGAARLIRAAVAGRGRAGLIVATGASQFEMLDHLVREEGVDWAKVTVFHLDEYLGLPATHPASFRRYLKERFADRLPTLGVFHYVDGEVVPPRAECERLGRLIRQHPIDVACIGIGENGHVAFNDPPADFVTEDPYLVVDLDEACRRQQLGEGWFPSLDAVPRQAISMSVRQILKSASLVCTVPDQRKAEAVRRTLEGPVTPEVPASILQTHPACTLYLDAASSSLLSPGTRSRAVCGCD